ncbi:MAG: GlcNAc-PI de-N-acetylase [Pseudohongiella sp.]|nr:MAG: GlcNAc-PI de-N-acetylase [Pseudohongiella sp.]
MRAKLSIALGLCLLTGIPTVPSSAQVRPIYDQGSGALVRQLQRLQTTASVMHTGAHPDDEDSALVAYHARGEHARTAYLSLTRGSGGQNIIGAEQSDALGIIRTEELLQARTLDGAEQLFTRANDFGFSKYRSEAARVWPEELLLEDMVRSIRTFRPDVVVSRWNGTPADGHGHHQFTGYLTPIAVDAAADPNRFPDQLAEGLLPWRVLKLYTGRPVIDGGDAPILDTNTGELDPLSGRTYFEIGMQGRSQQKTQQMGSLELHGRQQSRLVLMDSKVTSLANENSVFSGIESSITSIGDFEANAQEGLIELLSQLQQATAAILPQYNPLTPQSLIPALANALELARRARDLAEAFDSQRLLDEKITELEAALVLAAGVTVDALADSETVIPGATVTVAVRTFIPDSAEVAVLAANLNTPAGWSTEASDAQMLTDERNSRRRESADVESYFDVAIPSAAAFTQPYWLQRPRTGAAYDWGEADGAQTRPFAAATLTAAVEMNIGGALLTVEREVQYRQLDRIRGEVRRRVDVVPAVSVEPGADLVVLPMSAIAEPRQLLLTLRNNSAEPQQGVAQYSLPEGWLLEPASIDFTLAPAPATTTLSFTVTMADDVEAGEYLLAASATIGGDRYSQAMHEIAYPHIRTHRSYSVAQTEFEVIDVAVAAERVAYVMGSGDTVPEALRRLGLDVVLLTDEQLTTAELSGFDAIVIGIRASQTRPAYVANNRRLLDYAERGGTLVVQYQQPDFIDKNLAPFAASMEGNVRVVDETAAITILEAEHPAFTFPNRIGPQDFDGWVQERNNYNITSFDRDAYVPLTEAHDQGEADSDGGMLYAALGEGHYIYTSYSWFRQLPNGVPGAYRIFANLLSLSSAP